MYTETGVWTVLGKVKDASEKLYGDKLNRIVLYGSYARGEHTEESDMDIMIVLNCDVSEIKKFRSRTSEMASDISLDEGVFLSILLRDKKHFEDNMDFLPFYQNIAREGISVYG